MSDEFFRVLSKYGFNRERAELCARLFADASRDGVYTHGLNRFPGFIDFVRKGIVNASAEPVLLGRFGVLERWDGQSGPGNLNAWFAMGRAIELARENGMGCVALRNTNHWMRAGNYGWQAADAGCIGICWTNTVALVPPWGSRTPRLGNNPMVIAVPHLSGHIVLDMAMTQFSHGRLQVYRSRNEPLPVEGGYGRDGRLTRDAKSILESGRPLPIGYWKGSGLAFALDLTATLLSGGLATKQISMRKDETGQSQVFIAFDCGRMNSPEFTEQMINEVVDYVHSAEPLDEAGRVSYPGERTMMTRRENLVQGIPVEPAIWQAVKEL
jgi:3-dehydro-L-gulonate 2-dehydrogenase